LVWGTALGAGPFAFGYALPWALGFDPPLALQLTAIPLGLVPLTFASAIVRYRLRDIEVIVKRGLAYTAFLAASVALYAGMLELTSFLVGNDADDHNRIIALVTTIVVARFVAEEVEFWRDGGIYYFVPCVFEGRAIAVLALGRKESNEPFNSEDLALLTAVASQVATAIENGRLYRELHLKAEELGRMREFNENILESLDDGLVVFDAGERIVRWNRALEGFYGIRREDAIGRTLGDVFDLPFVEALRAARQDHPYGATLYRAPIVSRYPARNAVDDRHGAAGAAAPGVAGDA